MNTDAYETSKDYSLLRKILRKGYKIAIIYRSARQFTTGRSLVRKLGVAKYNIDKYDLDNNIIFKDFAREGGFENFCEKLELEFIVPLHSVCNKSKR